VFRLSPMPWAIQLPQLGGRRMTLPVRSSFLPSRPASNGRSGCSVPSPVRGIVLNFNFNHPAWGYWPERYAFVIDAVSFLEKSEKKEASDFARDA